MATYFLWGSIAFLVLALLIGFFIGLGRGIKRSSTHIVFAVASIIIAFFITAPITNAIMEVNINVDGSLVSIKDYIIQMISQNMFDLSNFDSASAFIQNLPSAILNPIVFMVIMVLVYFLMDIIYLVVARVSFGTKRKDFSSHKPHRLSGAFVGLVESFLFVFVLFAPLTSLTNTYAEIASASATSQTQTLSEGNGEKLPTLGDILNEQVPPEVNEIINAYNNSALGKVCSIFGFDDAMFDAFSTFEIDGEPINFRSEIVVIADSYNDVVIFYNDVADNNFENLDFTPIKTSLNSLIDNNLFKTVIADTVRDFVVNFDEIKDSFDTEIPEVVQKIINDVQTRFSEENFDAYTYLSSDLKSVLNVVEALVNDGTLQEIVNLDTSNIENVMNFVVNNEETVSTTLKGVVGLNLVGDALPTFLEMASNELENAYQNEEGIIVGINTAVTKDELNGMVDSLLSIINEIKTLNDKENILDIIEADDILNAILNLNDIGGVLDSFGEILDEVNSLKIFNYTTKVEEKDVEVHAFENILKIMGIDVLGDDAHVDSALTTLNTYSSFFDYIKNPIVTIVDSGLVDVLNGGGEDFNAILDILTEKVNEDREFLAKLIMPFYDLDKASFNGQSLKEMVFDQVITTLEENLDGFVALSEGEDTYENWYEKLSSIGDLLNVLNDGDIEGQTYLKYMLSDNADQFELFSQMNKDNKVDDLLNILFANNMYRPLHETLFSEIDKQVGGITGVTPTTTYSNLQEKQEVYVSTIIELLNALNSNAINSPNLQEKLVLIGQVLDVLKTSAQENVFKEVFINIIWYLTGDVIDDNPIYSSQEPNENAEDIKAYIGVKDKATGYYDNSLSYEILMTEVCDVIDFADALNANISGIELNSGEDVTKFVQAIFSTIDTLYENDIDKGVQVINNAQKIVTGILDETAITKYGEQITTAIDTVFDDSIKAGYSAFKQPLKNLLGLGV